LKWIKQALSPIIGSQAEAYARTYLENSGLIFVCANYRCKSGEIDLILKDQDTLVFVEVKYRSNSSHGSAVEFFHQAKRRKFVSAIMHYFQQHSLNPNSVSHRIDLLGIDKTSHEPKVTWLKNV
jgi:putative endonuclease